ncbi:hypothetical protein [Vibrio mediterranei]|uniref:hypothetical protein n=1 Tax=Vibrio mediterranei TaxID=689 RepID=UPI00148C3D2E|nr:hypothetical protein [Vibrio mediterranei]NOH31028.1 hypothetical protein [Vibrio mediterranei]
MKNLHSILLIIALFCCSFSFAQEPKSRNYEDDRKVSECHVSSNRDLNAIYKDMNDCVKDDLNKDTELGELYRNLLLPDEPDEIIEDINWLYGFLVIVGMGVWSYKLFISQSSYYRDRIARERSNFIMKAVFVLLFLSIIASVDMFNFVTRTAVNNGLSIPFSQVTTLSKVKSQLTTVSDNAVTSSQSQIQQKALTFNSAVVDQHLCAVAHKQEILSPYGKEIDYKTYLDNPDYAGVSYESDDEIMCVESFLKENDGKSIQELDNSLLLVAAIRECSEKHSTAIKDCGYLNANSSMSELNAAFNKSALKMVDFTNEKIGVECKQDLAMFDDGKGRDEKFVPFCSTLRDGSITTFSSDLNETELQNIFDNNNLTLAKEISSLLAAKLVLSDKEKEELELNSKTYLLSFQANVDYFLEIENEKEYYLSEIDNLLNSFTHNRGSSRMRTNGRNLRDRSFDSRVYDSSFDYFFAINNDLRVMFDSSSLVQSAIFDDFQFLKDPLLLFGAYYGDEYRVNFNPFKGLQDNYNELMAVGIGMKLVAKMNIRQATINKQPIGIWSLIDTAALYVILLANAPTFFCYAITGILLGWFFVQISVKLTMVVLEIGTTLFLKQDIIGLLRAYSEIVITLFNQTAILIFSLAKTHMFAVVTLIVLWSQPLLKDGYLSTLLISIVIYIVSIIYLFKALFWVMSYVPKSLATTAEGFKGDINKIIKKAKSVT